MPLIPFTIVDDTTVELPALSLGVALVAPQIVSANPAVVGFSGILDLVLGWKAVQETGDGTGAGGVTEGALMLSIFGRLQNSDLRRTVASTTTEYAQRYRRRAGHAQVLTTTWETLDPGTVEEGYVRLVNVGDVPLEFGPLSGGSGVVCGRLNVSDPPAFFRWPYLTTLQARAASEPASGETAAIDVELWSI